VVLHRAHNDAIEGLISGAARPAIASPPSSYEGARQTDPLDEGSVVRLTSCGFHERGEDIPMLRLTDVRCEAVSSPWIPSSTAALATQWPYRNEIKPLERHNSQRNRFLWEPCLA